MNFFYKMSIAVIGKQQVCLALLNTNPTDSNKLVLGRQVACILQTSAKEKYCIRFDLIIEKKTTPKY